MRLSVSAVANIDSIAKPATMPIICSSLSKSEREPNFESVTMYRTAWSIAKRTVQ